MNFFEKIYLFAYCAVNKKNNQAYRKATMFISYLVMLVLFCLSLLFKIYTESKGNYFSWLLGGGTILFGSDYFCHDYFIKKQKYHKIIQAHKKTNPRKRYWYGFIIIAVYFLLGLSLLLLFGIFVVRIDNYR
jgi:hypothetical protein